MTDREEREPTSTDIEDDHGAHHEQLVRQLLTEVWSDGTVALVDELFAEDVRVHFQSEEQTRTRADYKDVVHWFHRTFPDLTVDSDVLLAAGDTVVALVTFRGRNEGALDGYDTPPTGAAVRGAGAFAFRVVDGRVAETWFLTDRYGMLQQLGVLPS